MDDKTLLAKSLTLLYRESQLEQKVENSSDLVRTVLKSVVPNNVKLGLVSNSEILNNIKSTVLEMCDNPVDFEYDKDELLSRIKLNSCDDDRYYEAIRNSIDPELNESSLKRTILNIKKSINNHFKEAELAKILTKASVDFNYNRHQISNVNAFIDNIITQLEPLQISNKSKDPAVISELDIGDSAGMNKMFDQIQQVNTGGYGYVTGWQDFNNMTQGCLRPGETVVIGALQHKYKTGFSLSLFMQLAKYNKPRFVDSGKKPLMLRISFEDDLNLNIQFMYQKLKFDETGEKVDFTNTSPSEMSEYVKNSLEINGFHIKLLRVNPTDWTYKSICNKIIELEAEGYAVEILMIDYLGMLPTTGCVVTGAIGSDKRDMLRRIRNFCAQRGILHITPHQLSSDAKALIRGSMSEDQFVKEIAEKGYWDGCRSLDQEMDLELYIHPFKYQGSSYLSVQRGKHRLPSIVEDMFKYFILPFPKGSPIPDDLNKEKISFRNMKEIMTSKMDKQKNNDDFLF